MDIFDILRLARSMRASDVHIIASCPPLARVYGKLQPIPDMPPLSGEDIDGCFRQLTSAKQQEDFQRNMELDFGYTVPDVGRVRCNAARQMGTTSMVVRLLPVEVPSIDDLRLPPIYKELIMNKRGLILVSGPTGSGKSTTLASMINHLNLNHSRRIVTVEDPVEYVYTSAQSSITQRELGEDTHTFAQALKHVLRQDPDVILIGEIRDLETASAVLTIAETGHLVLSTGHAPSAAQAVERIIDIFPPHERQLTQSRLASVLVAICCQALVPKVDGSGRIAAVEIMLASGAIRNLIREGRTHQLPNTIRTQARLGMRLLDQSLVHLFEDGTINKETMLAVCQDRNEILKAIGQGLNTDSDRDEDESDSMVMPRKF